MGKRKQKHNIKQEEQLIEKSTQQRCSADHKSRSTDDEEDATLLDQPAKKLRASATCGSILRRCSEQQSGSATVDDFLDQPVEGVRDSVEWGRRGIWWSSSNYYWHFTSFEERPFQHGRTRGMYHKLR